MSRALFVEVELAFARRSLPFDVTWVETPLDAGETWLLVGEDRGGSVARISVARRGDPLVGPAVPGAAHRRAYEALVTALRARGAAPATTVRDDELRVVGELGPRDLVEGDSLGLPICVALVSAWLDRAPHRHVAGTAEVLPGGKLRRVTELPAKLAALAKEWPGERRLVIVAEGQQLPADSPPHVDVIRVDHVVDALAHFGLEVSSASLPPLTAADLERRLAGFGADHEEGPPTGGWSARAREAWSVAEAFRDRDEWRHARAMSWAMLFALHAGDVDAAESYRRAISADIADGMDSVARIWYRIGSATTAIDNGLLDEAERLAREAVEEAGRVERAVRRELYGRALGTLGRVHLHAGAYERALSSLREAAAFHAEHLPAELARSRCYQATCERVAGEPATGLATAEAGLAALRAFPNHHTAGFLELERGRCLLALRRYEHARETFEKVIAGQLLDREYPRLGACRGLARALRGLGEEAAADVALRACLAVAADLSLPPMVRRVAALAAGEAILDGVGGPGTELLTAWNAVLPAADTDDDRRRAIDRFVY